MGMVEGKGGEGGKWREGKENAKLGNKFENLQYLVKYQRSIISIDCTKMNV